ncbi:MAG TPA: ribonuclease HII, partial [Bdellovibrionota bacterium]|nr:ribonuclease HII [Bdellovibrionota bacterium]
MGARTAVPKKRKRLPRPGLKWETELGHPSVLVAGVDEVGRGCLAGPVVAAAVILPETIDPKVEKWLVRVRDSKLVPPEVRAELAPEIIRWARASSIALATVEEIDRINIFHASHLAMRRAIEGLSIQPVRLIIDGNYVPKGFPWEVTAVVKGDQCCLSV